MLKILQFYVLRQLFWSFVATLVVLGALMTAINCVRLVHQEGLGLMQMIGVAPLLIPYMVAYVVPLSVLISTVMVFGRMAADNEITAMRTAGVNLFRVALPVLALSLLICIPMFYFNAKILPASHREKTRRIRNALVEVAATRFATGEMRLVMGRDTIIVGNVSGGRLEDIMQVRLRDLEGDRARAIAEGDYDPEKEELSRLEYLVVADHGEFEFDYDKNEVVIKYIGGLVFQYSKLKGQPPSFQHLTHEELTKTLDTSMLARSSRESPASMPISELKKRIEEILPSSVDKSADGEFARSRIARYRTEIHFRWALTLAPFIFAFIGLPLGIVARHSNRIISFFLALLPVFLVYYPLIIAGTAIASKGVLPPVLALQAANIVLGTTGAFLSYKLFRM